MYDDETKEKAQAIMEQQKEGTLTSEEAKAQLAELGVELPEKGMRGGDILADLDDQTKAKAETLLSEAKDDVAELGVDHLPLRGL